MKKSTLELLDLMYDLSLLEESTYNDEEII